MSELALVEERAAVLARNEEQLVTMTVDGQLFGLPILSVQDIVETHKITQVPRTPSAISGIMNLRGRIVTVINLRRILGRSDDSNSRMGVTVEFKGDLYTILVDQIGEVRLLDRSDFEAAPATLDTKLKQLCTGIYRLDGELLAVLDVNQILAPETIAQTPPIQFFARRPKEAADAHAAAQKALPAPANEESEDSEAAEPVAQTAKQGKNIFRKLKSAANGAGASSDPAPAAGVDEKASKGSASVKKATPPPSKGTSEKSSAPAKKPESSSPKPAAAAKPATKTGTAEPESAAPKAKPAPASAPKYAAQSNDLLELIGGELALASVVHGFYEKVTGDKRLASYFEGADMQRQGKAMQAFLATALKSSKSVAAPGHQWLSPKKGLNDDAFNACLSHFEAALHSRSVPEGTIFRVLAVFERYRESVVD
jgi:purine-binding chemotaxis protein CheW